jgi:hypothetical protein
MRRSVGLPQPRFKRLFARVRNVSLGGYTGSQAVVGAAGMMRQLFPIRALRGAFVAVGLIAAVLAAITSSVPGAHGVTPNAASPEFDANLRAWVGLSVLATVSLFIAIFLSRGWTRWALCALLALILWSGVEPARHYYQYVYGEHTH